LGWVFGVKSPVITFVVLLLFFVLLIGGAGYIYVASQMSAEMGYLKNQQREALSTSSERVVERLRDALDDILLLREQMRITGVLA